MAARCVNCKQKVSRRTRGRCGACTTYFSRTGKERPYRGDGRRARALTQTPCTENPHCVRCRSKMRRAGYKHSRPYFRCYGCGARALASGPRRLISPPEILAGCVACHRNLVISGRSREYLRCLGCDYHVRREGVIQERQPRQHRASCAQCRRPMLNGQSRGIRSFYCRRCQWAAQAHCTRQPSVRDGRLAAFVESYVPATLPREIRDEVVAEILIALLKSRRAGGGYGLRSVHMSTEVVREFIQAAWRRRHHEHKQISIFDGEFPLSERLVG